MECRCTCACIQLVQRFLLYSCHMLYQSCKCYCIALLVIPLCNLHCILFVKVYEVKIEINRHMQFNRYIVLYNDRDRQLEGFIAVVCIVVYFNNAWFEDNPCHKIYIRSLNSLHRKRRKSTLCSLDAVQVHFR